MTASTYYVRDVAGSIMGIYTGVVSPTIIKPLAIEEHTIHGNSRIGIFKRNEARSRGYTLYELTDHLGNVRAVIQKSTLGPAALVSSTTDYYPFGMPMPNKHTTANNYRYAFQGQEKDHETGMEAFELRLWDGRLGRWLTVDPKHEFHSPYIGMGNNPISLTDPDGGSTDCTGCPDGAQPGTVFNHPDYGPLTFNGNNWSGSSGVIGDDVVIITPKKIVETYRWSLSLKDPWPDYKWTWFENRPRSSFTVDGSQRSGLGSDLPGEVTHHIDANELITPGGGGGKLKGFAGFSKAARTQAVRNTTIILTKDYYGLFEQGYKVGGPIKSTLYETSTSSEVFDTIFYLHSFKNQSNKYESLSGKEMKKFQKENPDYKVYDTLIKKR